MSQDGIHVGGNLIVLTSPGTWARWLVKKLPRLTLVTMARDPFELIMRNFKIRLVEDTDTINKTKAIYPLSSIDYFSFDD